MELELSQEQQRTVEAVRVAVRTKVRPCSLEADRAGRFPDALLLELAQLGLTGGLDVAPPDEGAGAAGLGRAQATAEPVRTAALVVEALAWGDAALVLALPGPGFGGPPVRALGTPEQRARLLAPFARADALRFGACAITEPGAGSDVAALRTLAVRDGHRYVLNGRKCYIANGARADWTVVYATVDPSRGRAGHRAFVVRRGLPGLRVARIERKLGLRAAETAELVLEDCAVEADELLGGERAYEEPARLGRGPWLGAVDRTRPLAAAMAVGIGRACLEHAQAFAREAYLLSRPLPRHAAVRALLGRMERRLQAARALVWQAASMADQGRPNGVEASMAKVCAADAAQQAAVDALDVLGAAADGDEALVEKWSRDAKGCDILEGTGQLHRVLIAQRLFVGPRSS